MKKVHIILLVVLFSCKKKVAEAVKIKDPVSNEIKILKKALTEHTLKTFNLLDAVFNNLDIKKENCKANLIVTQINPNNINETIVVIPEIVTEHKDYLELNSHILVVNSATGSISQRYFESSNTNGWLSDAIQLRKITIDTTSYIITDNTKALGVRVYFANTSRVNPYTYETFSLFKKSNNSLIKILHNFEVANQRGRWDTNCDSEFTDIKTTLIISNKKVNNHFNIIAKNNNAKSITLIDNNGECNSKDTITINPTVLKFNGETYVQHEYQNVTFNTLINTIPLKNTPLIDSTNYDNFTKNSFYNKEEILSLKLENIYPDFYKEGFNYRATSSYKLELSKAFYTIVYTIVKGDNEMESVLVNYDSKGGIIDSKVISYDEIAEGVSKIESKIKKNTLTVNNITWIDDKQQILELFDIDSKGKINRMDAANDNPETLSSILIERIIGQLDLDKLNIKEQFVTSKILPHNKNEIIVIIPEIAGDDDEYIYSLNSHIIIANTTTGKITHKYFESSKTNAWDSDAIILSEITIDTSSYQLTKNIKAFGIQVYSYGLSRVNPYSNRALSLFIKSGDTLKKVLHHYNITEYSGEWDGVCAGESSGVNNKLSVSKEQSEGYFNITVKRITTKGETFLDNNGDCDTKETTSSNALTLKFDGKRYE